MYETLESAFEHHLHDRMSARARRVDDPLPASPPNWGLRNASQND